MSNAVPAVWAVGLPERPLAATAVPSVSVCPGRTTNIRREPRAWDNDPKLVASTVMPVMVAFPGFADVRRMLPDAGSVPPSIACTWRLLMVTLLICEMLVTVMLTVTLVVVTVMLLTVISEAPEPPEILALVADPIPALNRQPLGAVRITVRLVWTTKSFVNCSVMTMFPSVVNTGATPFCALSAERFTPPVAAETRAVLTVWIRLADVLPLKFPSPLYTTEMA